MLQVHEIPKGPVYGHVRRVYYTLNLIKKKIFGYEWRKWRHENAPRSLVGLSKMVIPNRRDRLFLNESL
jgi:hypothetical protein